MSEPLHDWKCSCEFCHELHEKYERANLPGSPLSIAVMGKIGAAHLVSNEPIDDFIGFLKQLHGTPK